MTRESKQRQPEMKRSINLIRWRRRFTLIFGFVSREPFLRIFPYSGGFFALFCIYFFQIFFLDFLWRVGGTPSEKSPQNSIWKLLSSADGQFVAFYCLHCRLILINMLTASISACEHPGFTSSELGVDLWGIGVCYWTGGQCHCCLRRQNFVFSPPTCSKVQKN